MEARGFIHVSFTYLIKSDVLTRVLYEWSGSYYLQNTRPELNDQNCLQKWIVLVIAVLEKLLALSKGERMKIDFVIFRC